MLLLQEDGLIINHQGKGNIVLSNQDMSKGGLEKVGNPIVDFCIQPVDPVSLMICCILCLVSSDILFVLPLR